MLRGTSTAGSPALKSGRTATKQWYPKCNLCPWLGTELPQPLSLTLGASSLGMEDTHLAVLQVLVNNDLGLQPQTEASVQCDLVGACRGSQEEVLNLAGAGYDKFLFKTNRFLPKTTSLFLVFLSFPVATLLLNKNKSKDPQYQS